MMDLILDKRLRQYGSVWDLTHLLPQRCPKKVLLLKKEVDKHGQSQIQVSLSDFWQILAIVRRQLTR
ncbi:hypothetical protein ACH42_00665 [Endozoicomonas sp. (ex Bugula neritina AB1)]|nr:hypothetical protein ACH42_00665 [Endozoicomonas sp. (ex Bugula neritina AB1)]